jgi:hypothetical protein
MATAIGVDPNQSVEIDVKGGLRAMLNSAIRYLYREKAEDIKFRQDIAVDNAITITTGTGTLPDNVMREFLGQANISNSDGDLITYMDFPIDVTGGQTFGQLGYVWLTGMDTLNYRAPSPTLDTYSGTVTVSVPTFPTFGATMSDPITFPSTATLDDLCYVLALGIRGDLKLLDADWNE